MAIRNSRILVIDDEQVVRDTFLEILKAKNDHDEGMNNAAAALFDEPKQVEHKHKSLIDYDVDVAFNGQDGFDKVKVAYESGKPYALIFCDMRMPGWDGLTTVQQIRSIDAQAEIVFVTAYSDHSAEEVTRVAGPNVGYHCKPFEADEIRQIATKAICDWSKLRDLENLIQVTSNLNIHEDDLSKLLKNILQQIAAITDNRTALLVVHKSDPSILMSVGDKESVGIEIIATLNKEETLNHEKQTDQYLYLPMSDYGVLLMKDDSSSVVDDNRIYLIRLFVQQAAKAIDNASLRRELEAKKRLSDLGRAASCIIHDLKQPINVISGVATMLKRPNITEEKKHKILGFLKSASSDMNEFVNDILEFSNDKAPEYEKIDVGELIQEILAEYELSQQNEEIEILYSPGDPTVISVDKLQLRRCIKNLVNNAAEALISLKIENPTIEISASNEAGNAAIRVSDNGPGIPEEIRETLFEPFVTKGKVAGTGLGLAITKKMITLNQGQIDFNSSDKGTEFKLTFPCV